MSRILLAEDDRSVRAFVARALRMDGHEVVETDDGGLALEAMEEAAGRFDLMLSDIKMPVMDGIALALSVADRFPWVTIVLMTGFAEQRERAHGLEALIHDVIAKPFALDELRARIDAALGAGQTRTEPQLRSQRS